MYRLREFIQKAAALIRREQIFKVLAILILVTLLGSRREVLHLTRTIG